MSENELTHVDTQFRMLHTAVSVARAKVNATTLDGMYKNMLCGNSADRGERCVPAELKLARLLYCNRIAMRV